MATTVLDPDVFRSASTPAMGAGLTAPFAGGATQNEVAIAPDGTASVAWSAREPVLLAAPQAGLGDETLELTGTLTAPDSVTLPALSFMPYTEAGAQLPLYLPSVDPASAEAQPFTVALTATRTAPDGTRTTLAPAQLATVVSLTVLEGVLGRALYVAAAEKQRIRRQAREIQAMRRLGAAHLNALDRTGADLGVLRFTDQLAFDSGTEQILTVRAAQPEPDADYRRRLGLYRPWRRSTLGAVTELLNGPGAPADANAGPLSQLAPTLTERFSILDSAAPMAVAIHLVSAGDDQIRAQFLSYIRATMLIWPADSAAADDVHGARFLPAAEKQRVEQVRTALRAGYAFTAGAETDPALASVLADALVRVANCRLALGDTSTWTITRAQANDAGSRYELGLGIDVELPAPAVLDQLHAALVNPARTADGDPEIEALLESMTPESSAADPEGRWLLEPCGLRTVHRLDAGTLFVSHLPVFGLVIDGASTAPLTAWSALVPGNFGGWLGSDVFAYQRESGTGQFFAVVEGEMFALGAPITGLPTTWTQIVSGNFAQDRVTDAIACYDPADGRLEARFYSVESNTLTALGTPLTGLGATISQLVTGSFGVAPHTNLMLYDPVSGTTSFYNGNFNAMRALSAPSTDAGGGYTHVVAGAFSAGEESALLFYDRTAGRGAFYAVDSPGRLRPLAEHHDWQSGWTHVAVGYFSSGENAQVLFYNRDTGAAELNSSDQNGNLVLARSLTDWDPNWTQVLPGSWATNGYSSFLLHNATTSRAEFDLLGDGLGRVQFGAATGPAVSGIELDGHYYAAESQDSNVVLEAGLTAAMTAWQTAGNEAVTRLSTADANTAWALAAANDSVRQALQDGGLPSVSDPVGLSHQLTGVASDLVATLALGPNLTASVRAGAGAEEIHALIGMLRENDIPSAVGFATSDGRVLLVIGVIGLPVAGLNLSEQTATGFRWYAVPIVGMRPWIGPAGTRTQLTAGDWGLSAVVLLGYARQGGVPDPYQFTVDLPADGTLSLEQYEFLMNTLELACPAGVSVNTYAIRQNHVSLGGSVTPLGPRLSRTYRPFRRPRSRGMLDGSGSAVQAAPTAAWGSLGGEVFGGIATALDAGGRVHVFSRRQDGTVAGIAQLEPGGRNWSDWASLGGSAAGVVAASVDHAGTVHVVARLASGAIGHLAQTAGGWGAWEQIASPAGELLAVGVDSAGSLLVVAGRSDNSIWSASAPVGGAWSAWTTTNGTAVDRLVMTANSDDRLQVLGAGLDRTLATVAQSAPAGPWGAWSSLGGGIRDGLAVARNADGRLQAFACGLDGNLATAAQSAPGGAWGAWSGLGGRLAGALAAGVNADGTVCVLATAVDNTVVGVAQTAPGGAFGPWQSLGGAINDYLAVIRGSDGRLELFGRGWDNELWHASQTAPGAGWGA